MALSAGLALVLLAQGPITVTGGLPTSEFEIGYDKLLAGQDAAAIAEIEAGDKLAADDPARLVNHGIALARLGRTEEARAKFEAVAEQRDRVELETASGNWVDSRSLAHRALAMIDRGELAHRYALLLR